MQARLLQQQIAYQGHEVLEELSDLQAGALFGLVCSYQEVALALPWHCNASYFPVDERLIPCLIPTLPGTVNLPAERHR